MRPKGSKNKGPIKHSEAFLKKHNRVLEKRTLEFIKRKKKAEKRAEKKAKKWAKVCKKWKKYKKPYVESKYAKMRREEEELHPSTGLRVCKALGFCPKCNAIVGKMDLEKGKKGIVVCMLCGFRGKVSKLSKGPIKKDNHPKSRKDYLDETQEILESMPKINEDPIAPEEIGKIDNDEW